MTNPDAAIAMPQVRTVTAARGDREWFWRIIAALMVAAVGWVGWVAWQLQPREPVVTPAAFKASQDAQRKRQQAPVVVVEPKPALPAVVVVQPVQPAPTALEPQAAVVNKPVPLAEKPVPATSPSLAEAARQPAAGKPIRDPSRKPAQVEQGDLTVVPPPAGKPRGPITLNLDVPPARILQAPAAAQSNPSRVEKKDRLRGADDRAESDFRRGAALLNQGRAADAEEAFGAALAAHPGHEAARQALVAMNLEQGRMDTARRLLQEGVAVNPGNPRFAAVLARIHAERRDYAGALEVTNGVSPSARTDPELLAMRGSMLQKLGRHAEAVDAFRTSLRAKPENGAAWLGMGVSLEALGTRPEAAEAFRRAASTDNLGTEARGYAEQRARQLQ